MRDLFIQIKHDGKDNMSTSEDKLLVAANFALFIVQVVCVAAAVGIGLKLVGF